MVEVAEEAEVLLLHPVEPAVPAVPAVLEVEVAVVAEEPVGVTRTVSVAPVVPVEMAS